MRSKKKKHNTKKIVIALKEKEVELLKKMISRGRRKAREITRARILLLSHTGKKNKEIISALSCAPYTIADVRKRYLSRGSVEKAIVDAPRPGQPKKITATHEAFVIATACTTAPKGHSHWTLDELRKKLLKTYTTLKSVSDERIRHILIKSALKPWREKNVVRSKTHARIPRTNG